MSDDDVASLVEFFRSVGLEVRVKLVSTKRRTKGEFEPRVASSAST
jgi:hypothetical protein